MKGERISQTGFEPVFFITEKLIPKIWYPKMISLKKLNSIFLLITKFIYFVE